MSSTFALSQLLYMETHEVPVILEWPVTYLGQEAQNNLKLLGEIR